MVRMTVRVPDRFLTLVDNLAKKRVDAFKFAEKSSPQLPSPTALHNVSASREPLPILWRDSPVSRVHGRKVLTHGSPSRRSRASAATSEGDSKDARALRIVSRIGADAQNLRIRPCYYAELYNLAFHVITCDAVLQEGHHL